MSIREAVLTAAMLPFLLFAGAKASAAEQDEAPEWKIIHAGQALLVPGETPKQRVSIVVRGDSIERITDGYATSESLGVQDARVIDLDNAFVLPGLMDAHVHITSQGSRSLGETFEASRLLGQLRTSQELAVLGVANARDWMDAGYTTVRDTGADPGAVFALRDGIESGIVPGPRIYAAGKSISPTGGHSDPPATLRVSSGDKEGVCDGPVECIEETRRQIRVGADLIKLHATGGGSEESGSAEYAPSFTDDEFAAIIDTAHGLGRKVAAHAHGSTGINAALRAGVDSIDHGDGLNDESIELFLETGAYLVPTLSMVNDLQRRVDAMEEFGETPFKSRYEGVIREMPLEIGRAWEAGVKIAAGSDRHVSENVELEWYVRIGMSPGEAIVTATVNAAHLIGIGDRAGSLEPGKWADIIAVADNPVDDIEVLDEVVFVMKGGKVHKLSQR